jgi:hypothetical protein
MSDRELISIDDVAALVVKLRAQAVTEHRSVHGSPRTLVAAAAEKEVLADADVRAKREVQRAPDGLKLWTQYRNSVTDSKRHQLRRAARGKIRAATTTDPDALIQGVAVARSSRREMRDREMQEYEQFFEEAGGFPEDAYVLTDE